MKTKITVIGLGAMGSALAKTFVTKGHTVTVWNRDSTKAPAIIGAEVVNTVEAAIQASPVVVVCVSDYPATRSILEHVSLKGKTLVQLSTGTPEEARVFKQLAVEQGAAYIDGAILAWPSQIGLSDTTILAAGDESTFRAVEPVLKDLAGNLTYMGEAIGTAAALFYAVLAYLAGSWIGFCHGALIYETEGLNVEDFGAVMHTIAPILGAESRHMGEVIRRDEFYQPESTIKTSGSDIGRLVQQANEAGINSEFPQFAAGLFRRAIDEGYGGEEHAALIKVLRKGV